MTGKVIVTGASGAMGAAATQVLAAQGRQVIMACRNLEKAGAVRNRILSAVPGAKIEIRHLDLASLASVRAFIDGMKGESVSALLNNAGVISRKYSLTEDGLENTFAVNFFGPVLLTLSLLPLMAPEASIVNTVSLTCKFVNITEQSLHPDSSGFSQLGTYARSKLALLHFSEELIRRNPSKRINLADPGVVNSNMISMGRWFDPLADALFRPFCKSPGKGVKPALSALASEESGEYYVGQRIKNIPARFVDPELDRLLWDETLKIIG